MPLSKIPGKVGEFNEDWRVATLYRKLANTKFGTKEFNILHQAVK